MCERWKSVREKVREWEDEGLTSVAPLCTHRFRRVAAVRTRVCQRELRVVFVVSDR